MATDRKESMAFFMTRSRDDLGRPSVSGKSRLRTALLALLIGTGSTGIALADCAEQLAPGHAFDTYTAVAAALRDGERPATVESVDCFLSGDIDGLSPDAAYRELIATSFHANVLYDYLREQERSVFRKMKASEGKGWSEPLAWRGGYLGEATITAYERTGDTRFLDFFVDYFNKVLTLRDTEQGIWDVYHNRVMESWSEYRWGRVWFGPIPVKVLLPLSHVTHAARITLAPSRFIEIVMNDPALAGYKPAAERYLDASLAALGAFDVDRTPIVGTDLEWYIRPNTGEAEATNHIHTLGSVYINLAEVTGDEEMRRRIDEILEVFEKGVKSEADGTVHWEYFPYFADDDIGPNGLEYSERIWKASQTAPFLYRAYKAGYAVPEDLIAAVTQTFLTHVLRDNEVLRNLSPVESRHIKGNDRHLSRLNGIMTWLEYSDYAPEIADRIRELVGTRPDLFPNGWFHSTNGARGYAHFLGREPGETAMATTQPPASGAPR